MRYLKPAVKDGIFDVWVDRQMTGGADWEPEIEAKLHAWHDCRSIRCWRAGPLLRIHRQDRDPMFFRSGREWLQRIAARVTVILHFKGEFNP
jgi:hypothetical protein